MSKPQTIEDLKVYNLGKVAKTAGLHDKTLSEEFKYVFQTRRKGQADTGRDQ